MKDFHELIHSLASCVQIPFALIANAFRDAIGSRGEEWRGDWHKVGGERSGEGQNVNVLYVGTAWSQKALEIKKTFKNQIETTHSQRPTLQNLYFNCFTIIYY